MSLFQKAFGWLSSQKNIVSAPREQLLYTGAHPIVPFVLRLEEGQSSYFYNRGQSPIKGIHLAGDHEHNPEHIPATNYLVINRELVTALHWDVVYAVGDFVLQLLFVARVQVLDALKLAEYFAHADKAQNSAYLTYRLQKSCEQWVSALSVADAQHFVAKHQQHFVARLQSALEEMGLEGLAIEIKSDFHARPTPAPQAPSTATLINREPPPEAKPSVQQSALLNDEALFYFLHLGKRHGPVAAHEIVSKIQRGELERTVCVWKMGMGQWTPAHQCFQWLE